MDITTLPIRELLGRALRDQCVASVNFTRLVLSSVLANVPIGLFVVQYFPHKSPEIIDGRMRHSALRSIMHGFVFEVDGVGLSSLFLADDRMFYVEAGRFAGEGGDPKKLERMRDRWDSYVVPVATLGEHANGGDARAQIEAGRVARPGHE